MEAGMRGAVAWLLIGGLAAGCRGGEPGAYPQPPAETYTAAIFQVAIEGEPTSLAGAAVGPGFFDAARIRPMLGRSFTEADYADGASPTALVGHGFWTTRLGSSPEVIGRTIEIDGSPATIVGIAPRGFEVPEGAVIWVPRRPAGVQ
jgi:hypothetical protein